MDALADSILASRKLLPLPPASRARAAEAEGGCGVIGMASSVPLAGRHLLQALLQMRNRGNGKGGGIAAVGIDPEFLGVTSEILERDYLLAVAYLDPAARAEAERSFVEPTFEVDRAVEIRTLAGARTALGLDVEPPEAVVYFVRVRPDVREAAMKAHGFADAGAAEDEIVYQNTYRLNRAMYASDGEKRAFVLSHGKDLLVLKMVGYGDDVVRAYRLEDLRARVWIGHHRYPTKGRVWHPGGAHPFIGMHEALVHNGDFANYASISSYLAQRNIYPLFLTDTEVAVLAFDLLHRVYGYSMEHVIETMAPTTERDFALLPEERRHVYRMLQAVHIHGSPDGPWFFLIAQADPRERSKSLIGITDTSMLRPQVFALQRGEAAVGFAASEKQAIDAALGSLSAEDGRFWPRADLYWNARGGSHTDGGAFRFTARPDGEGAFALVCEDKFGRRIDADPSKRPPGAGAAVAAPAPPLGERAAASADAIAGAEPEAFFRALLPRFESFSYADVAGLLARIEHAARDEESRLSAVQSMTLLLDRPFPGGVMKRSVVLSMVEGAIGRILHGMRATAGRHRWAEAGHPLPDPAGPDSVAIVDARGYPPEGPRSLARAVVDLVKRGFRRLILSEVRGQRFLGSGLGPDSQGVTIDVHGSAQDQLAQIMKSGTLVVHGDVGQTFMYGAKGGSAFILGNAAGRPLINAVGRPRVVINGTCLDYLAESFMAGDPLNGGGFVILNGVAFDENGAIRELNTPYPGGNLFSLASGGAIYVRDPRGKLSEDQLNGGEFAPLAPEDWETIRPHLEENERRLGVPMSALLAVDGRDLEPARVYRKIRPAGHAALLPEEAWVRREG